MNKKNKVTYDFVCFSELAYEFNNEKDKNIESKIKRSLRYYNLGKYDIERVNYLRLLQKELYVEISKFSNSKYYIGSHGVYADSKDFDFEKMKNEYLEKYCKISNEEMWSIINFSIYLYYLR